MLKLVTPILLLMALHCEASDHLPEVIEQNNSQFEQCDSFTLRYGFVIKVVDIGWYAPNCQVASPILEADNKIVRFHYHKNVEADFFRDSAEEYFLLNLNGSDQKNQLEQPLLAFNAGYTDIADGEYFDLVHTNGQSLSLYKNNQLLASSDNSQFSQAYFNIWFGEQPVIQKLKKRFNSCQAKTISC